jgi:hypothetical protein
MLSYPQIVFSLSSGSRSYCLDPFPLIVKNKKKQKQKNEAHAFSIALKRHRAVAGDRISR